MLYKLARNNRYTKYEVYISTIVSVQRLFANLSQHALYPNV